MPDPAPSIRPPRQERSRQTLERMLDATERLLDERPFEAITIQDVIAAAETSVGAFYARFRDKDALLPALYARYDAGFGTWVDGRRDDRSLDDRALRDVVDALVGDVVAMFSGRTNLLRAMSIHARRHPDMIDAATRARRAAQMTYVRESLLACRDEIDHPDPERAVDLAAFFLATVCRESLLFGDATHAQNVGVRRAELVRETARMMYSYLKGPA